MDGELISNLVKQTDYKPVQNDEDEEEKQAKNSIMDDYVLHRLFKKSGRSRKVMVFDNRVRSDV